ncbi:MAG: ABC transporter permease [Chrysiogenetes bacterium]|nr:ABC transporter permease [Chrysiogenetes bacterium]
MARGSTGRGRASLWIGAVIVGVLALIALAAPWLSSYDPTMPDLAGELAGPGAAHLLGQDELGRDLWARLAMGSRVSLSIGLAVVFVSSLVGTLLGGLCGYRGGLWDSALMRVIDVLQAFPGILLAIALAYGLGPGYLNVVFALSVLGWVGYARLVRGQVLQIREEEFVQAARAVGVPDLQILIRHIYPNLLGPLAVQCTFGLAAAILSESSLAFLGLGVQGVPSWGAMLDGGTDFLLVAPHVAFFPGAALFATILAFNFLGDGLRDLLDVKGRA